MVRSHHSSPFGPKINHIVRFRFGSTDGKSDRRENTVSYPQRDTVRCGWPALMLAGGFASRPIFFISVDFLSMTVGMRAGVSDARKVLAARR